MEWNKASIQLLNTYRVSHNLSTPAAFTSPLRQALLTNPGIGRQSPTMARKREQRRVSKDQVALAVRKNFNGAAVSEIDVVVELVYKVRNQGELSPPTLEVANVRFCWPSEPLSSQSRPVVGTNSSSRQDFPNAVGSRCCEETTIERSCSLMLCDRHCIFDKNL